MPSGRRNRVRPFVPEQEKRNDLYPKKSMFCVKYVLFFMNVFFWFASCVLLAVGIYAMINKQQLYGKFSNLTTDPAVLLVLAGGVMFFIACGGCLGALRENICLLKFYSAMLGLMLLLEIAAAVLGYVYQGEVRSQVDDAFRLMILRYRDDPDLQMLIDSVQKELKCCGSKDYRDWNNNIYFNCSSPSVEKCSVPFSCCISDQINMQCGFNMQAVTVAEAEEKIYTRGCLEGVEAWLKSNLITMAAAASVLPVVQILGFCLSRRLTGDIQEIVEQYQH